ncbi:MAG: tRNA 2-thiouridine(34) synthase MnmA [Candidatus Liptonbacteria bacterium]|nr:tRNA 2-thiouridine(34) synthase MnmA [Candidatus Liptonbacteria bacterium]
MKINKLVFVGMSGGVDSSVAAYLLKKDGYDVVGVFIRGYNVDGCQDRDAEDARKVAGKLGTPFYVWNFEKEYKKKVVDYMIAGYRRGETPNPDVMCNKEIKFGLFFERAMKLGADYVATGHYVRKSGGFLRVAKDANKDQSYFLWTLTPKQIEKSLFPIGEYLKPEVRKIAKRAGLPTAEKKDSQGICFLGEVNFKDFLKKYIPEKTGAVLDSKGKKIGEHMGAHFYTIGQRGGVGNLKHEKGQKNHVPLYVVKKDVKKNILVVAEGAENPELYKKSVYLGGVNFRGTSQPSLIRANMRIDVSARVRYRQSLFDAVLSRKNGKWRLDFKTPQKFVAPGQSAVFYSEKGEMLGGGIITVIAHNKRLPKTGS